MIKIYTVYVNLLLSSKRVGQKLFKFWNSFIAKYVNTYMEFAVVYQCI